MVEETKETITRKLVMAQVLNAEKEIRTILHGQNVPEWVLERLIKRFKDALVIIPGQPAEGFKGNNIDLGRAWVKANYKMRDLEEGDAYRGIILNGGMGIVSTGQEPDPDDVNSVYVHRMNGRI